LHIGGGGRWLELRMLGIGLRFEGGVLLGGFVGEGFIDGGFLLGLPRHGLFLGRALGLQARHLRLARLRAFQL
jgi:hypothetical protein